MPMTTMETLYITGELVKRTAQQDKKNHALRRCNEKKNQKFKSFFMITYGNTSILENQD